MSGNEYAANTNNAFLLNETASLAQALLDGFKPSEVRRKAVEEGLIEHRSALSRTTFAREILNRLESLEPEILGFLTGVTELRRVTNLYTFMRHQRLLREFALEVLRDKQRRFDHTLRQTDVSAFFSAKLEDSPAISSWTDGTLRKARTNMIQVLTDAQVIVAIPQTQNFEILPVRCPTPLREFLVRAGRLEELAWFD